MTDFVPVPGAGAMKAGQIRHVDIKQHEVALVRTAEQFFACSNVCTCESHFVGHGHRRERDPHTHDGALARLAEGGLVKGDRVQCPLHESEFDLKTGKPVSGAAEIPLATYEVRVIGDEVMVATMSDVQRHFWNDEGATRRP